ncbi:hypothetical protein CcI49_35565 [Frankia sp. CcI49]|uniref:DUF1254 domain-containing protein n=1 Tax=unclassified Frankia TaxID=2632575 RepID=UPI0006CA2701|nr:MULTISPECIES: DUF1254 domain-containing protein [unclassified Frankia]KPM53635.1 ATP synthase subunit alpha [Frankia sp. R43]ONH51392.1 hypothetical protein CcI49_35565 [Frankia sp. CcI49]
MTDDLLELATDAYIYGFPLVYNLMEVERISNQGMGTIEPAPFNVLSHASALAGPADRFVSINNDTIYSFAQVDVSGGPLLLRVPDTSGRYYVLQFIDAWTNNFAYVGRRATGTAAASFLLVPPGWRAGGPAGVPVIEFPTAVGSIVGRWACDGPADLANVRTLQSSLTLEAAAGAAGSPGTTDTAGTADATDADAGLVGIPAPTAVPIELAFFERMRAWMRAFPPAGPDFAYQQRFAPLGLLDEASPYADAPPELAKALTAGQDAGKQRIEDRLRKGGPAPVVNGWAITFHMFDYNLDHLGLGTIDTPEWKIDDREAGYLARALAARAGLWGNHGYEAAYPMTYTDSDGDQLDGHGRYTIRFDQEPPVDAFWSITMYDLPGFHLVANSANRYSIGDRTPGLQRDGDGSLTIVIQHDPPADTRNWLPAPAGPFRPILRLYQPRAAVLDGTYQLPAITKARPRSTA